MLKVELGELQGLNFDLSLTGFDPGEIDGSLAEKTEGLTDPDQVPEVPERAVTVTGDTWILGRNRLRCGDSTAESDVSQLMNNERADLLFTSPPYAQQRDYGAAKEKVSDWDSLMRGVFSAAPVKEGSQILVNLGLVHKDGEWIPYWQGWIDWMRESGWRRFGWYIWDQGPGLPGDWNGRLAPSHEFIFHFNRQSQKANKTKESKWAGHANHGSGLRAKDGTVTGYSHAGKAVQDRKIADSVFRVMRHKARGIEKAHPAVFPVALVEEAFGAYSKAGDVVFEPFCGSGTQIIAAEKMGRHCFGMELDPVYVDVAIKRWQDFTGQKAILESTGRTFDDMASDRHKESAA
jgi:DNA modification methylase